MAMHLLCFLLLNSFIIGYYLGQDIKLLHVWYQYHPDVNWPLFLTAGILLPVAAAQIWREAEKHLSQSFQHSNRIYHHHHQQTKSVFSFFIGTKEKIAETYRNITKKS